MFWLVLSWVGFYDTDRVKGEDNQLCIFCFVPYNKLLTSLACSSSAGKYWPSAIIVRTLLQLFCIATTLGQYSPVWRLCSVSKRFILKKICIFFMVLSMWLCIFCVSFWFFFCSQWRTSSISAQESAMGHAKGLWKNSWLIQLVPCLIVNSPKVKNMENLLLQISVDLVVEKLISIFFCFFLH